MSHITWRSYPTKVYHSRNGQFIVYVTSLKDNEGFLTLKGRVKDRITLVNTKKIQSTEIEEMIIKD